MLTVVAVLLATGPALAQTPPPPGAPISAEGKALGACMIANSTPEHERLMKVMMIDALNEDTDGLNKSVLAVTAAIVAMGQQSCGLKLTDLQKPAFEEAMGLYGEHLGEKIMTRAMDKLGI
jgi:hypothetical protein